MQAMLGVLLGGGDFLARELAGGDRIIAFDARRHFAVGDPFDFERVQSAKLGDLVESQGGVFDQPDSSRLRHQWRVAHERKLLDDRMSARSGSAWSKRSLKGSNLRGKALYRLGRPEL